MPFRVGEEVLVEIVEPHMYVADDAVAKIDGYIISVRGGGRLVGQKLMVRIEEVGRTAADGGADRRDAAGRGRGRADGVESAARRRGRRGGRRRSAESEPAAEEPGQADATHRPCTRSSRPAASSTASSRGRRSWSSACPSPRARRVALEPLLVPRRRGGLRRRRAGEGRGPGDDRRPRARAEAARLQVQAQARLQAPHRPPPGADPDRGHEDRPARRRARRARRARPRRPRRRSRWRIRRASARAATAATPTPSASASRCSPARP